MQNHNLISEESRLCTRPCDNNTWIGLPFFGWRVAVTASPDGWRGRGFAEQARFTLNVNPGVEDANHEVCRRLVVRRRLDHLQKPESVNHSSTGSTSLFNVSRSNEGWTQATMTVCVYGSDHLVHSSPRRFWCHVSALTKPTRFLTAHCHNNDLELPHLRQAFVFIPESLSHHGRLLLVVYLLLRFLPLVEVRGRCGSRLTLTPDIKGCGSRLTLTPDIKVTHFNSDLWTSTTTICHITVDRLLMRELRPCSVLFPVWLRRRMSVTIALLWPGTILLHLITNVWNISSNPPLTEHWRWQHRWLRDIAALRAVTRAHPILRILVQTFIWRSQDERFLQFFHFGPGHGHGHVIPGGSQGSAGLIPGLWASPSGVLEVGQHGPHWRTLSLRLLLWLSWQRVVAVRHVVTVDATGVTEFRCWAGNPRSLLYLHLLFCRRQLLRNRHHRRYLDDRLHGRRVGCQGAGRTAGWRLVSGRTRRFAGRLAACGTIAAVVASESLPHVTTSLHVRVIRVPGKTRITHVN